MMAVIDWFSKFVLSWKMSNSLECVFCITGIEEAINKFGSPDIVNTDQGCQFTSEKFTSCLKRRGIAISMDGKGRALDNIMIEHLWRTLKYKEVYLKNYREKTMRQAYNSLTKYFDFYNLQTIFFMNS